MREGDSWAGLAQRRRQLGRASWSYSLGRVDGRVYVGEGEREARKWIGIANDQARQGSDKVG